MIHLGNPDIGDFNTDIGNIINDPFGNAGNDGGWLQNFDLEKTLGIFENVSSSSRTIYDQWWGSDGGSQGGKPGYDYGSNTPSSQQANIMGDLQKFALPAAVLAVGIFAFSQMNNSKSKK